MKAIFREKKILIIIIALILVIIMGIAAMLSGGRASPISNFIGIIISPVTRGTGSIADWFSSIYGYMYEFDSIKEENRLLKIKIAEMEERERLSVESIKENERLRDLLELKQRRRDFVIESATILSWSSSNWASSFTIGKGAIHEIKPNDCVITEEGNLVGFVTEVGVNWAAVTTIIDTETEIGALIFRTHEVCMAEGDFSFMEKGLLKLTFLPKNTELLNGDMIMTSGTGGIFPRELVIGTVSEVKMEDTGLNRYAAITPAVDFDALTQVFVIKSFDIEE